jgi:phosphopantothenoylcysteine decarboxylase / phosphopantothenate---cysteine ligase
MSTGERPERNVVLGVSGSIAAYKAVDLASRLTQAGVQVHVVMTEAATQLVGPASFRAITGRPVSTQMFELSNPHAIEHISLADRADVFLVAPATANVLAKLAHGIADDLLTCTALATRAPLALAPAMHTAMWEHAATQENVNTLKTRGATFLGPARGRLASGGMGTGRFAPVLEILGGVLQLLGRDGDLAGRRIVITAGGTREPIDPVRYLGNRSTGKMGFALAEAARDRGAVVTLISGPTRLSAPTGVTQHAVNTAAEMLTAVRAACDGAEVLIMAAAVADYAPQCPEPQKLKKQAEPLLLRLERTVDILDTVRNVPVRVGFAAESQALLENARKKLQAKDLDLVVANDISRPDSGFAADENEAVLLDREGHEEPLARQSKRALADRILDRIAARLRGA